MTKRKNEQPDDLKLAFGGDTAAQERLKRKYYSLTVFAPNDEDKTRQAIEYYEQYGVAPETWDDEPLVTAADAFFTMVKLDPTTLKPVTPGTWTRFWEERGHEAVAAVLFGLNEGYISGPMASISRAAGKFLDGEKWPEFEDARVAMERAQTKKRIVMAAVLRSLPSRGTPFDTTARSKPDDPTGAVAIGPGAVAAGAGGVAVGGDVHGGVVVGRIASRQGQLRQFITALLSLSDLHDICFNLGIDWDNLAGSTLSSKARSLIAHLDNRERLLELEAQLKIARPSAWSSTFE